MLKIVQRSRDLIGGSRLASHQKLHTCQACQKLKHHSSCCTTGQKSQASQAVSSRLELATQSSHKAKSPDHPVWEKLTLRIGIPFSPHYIQALIPMKCRENFEREILEKNKIDSSTIFTQRLFKFLYSLPLHCYILERYITKTFSHHTHICEKAIWCFGKQLRMDQFHIGRYYGQVAESDKS